MATLPVIALGVGIGVDYALYVLTVILAKGRRGIPLTQDYLETLMFTGQVFALIGVTLESGCNDSSPGEVNCEVDKPAWLWNYRPQVGAARPQP